MSTTTTPSVVECTGCGGMRIPALHIRCPCQQRSSEAWRLESEALALREARSWAFRRGCPDAMRHLVAAPCGACPPPFNPWPVYKDEYAKLRAEG